MIPQLIDKYFNFMGKYKERGDEYDISPIIPIILMDIQYDYFTKHILKLEATHEARIRQKRWRDAYNSYMKLYKLIYNDNDWEELNDYMDSIESALEHNLFILDIQLQSAVMNDLPPDRQKIYSVSHICNIIAQAAQFFYGSVHKNSLGEPLKNTEIAAVRKNSIEFAFIYTELAPMAAKNAVNLDTIHKAVEVVCVKIVDWMLNQVQTEKKLYGLRTDKGRSPKTA